MSTTAPAPSAKSKSMFSLFSGAKPETDELPVLIRLRDLKQRAAPEPEPVSLEIADEPAAAGIESTSQPDAADNLPDAISAALSNASYESVAALVASARVESRSLQESLASVMPDSIPSAESTSVTTPIEPEPATPARRQRERRKAKKAGRDWSHTAWQGTVGALLLSLAVIVYFIMVGGGKKHDTSGTGADDGAPTAEGLETPEISIPELGESTPEVAASPSAQKNSDAPESSAANEFKTPTMDASLEPDETAGDFGGPKGTSEKVDAPAIREAAKPRDSYPVTPAQATYPATDPGKFRYPDDTRPTAPRAKKTKRPAKPVAPPGGEWNEDEQSPNKFR